MLGLVYLHDVRKSTKSLETVDAADDNVMKHLRDLFEQFAAGDEGVTFTELKAIMQEINPDVSSWSVLKIFQSVDEDGNGTIDFAEFHAAFVKSATDNRNDNTLDMRTLIERTDRANIGADAAGRLFLLVFLMSDSEII